MEETDKKYHQEIDLMFHKKLFMREITIFIKDLEKNEILYDLDYNLVVFDNNLNIYKLKEGVLIPVDNPNFQAIVVHENTP